VDVDRNEAADCSVDPSFILSMFIHSHGNIRNYVSIIALMRTFNLKFNDRITRSMQPVSFTKFDNYSCLWKILFKLYFVYRPLTATRL